jgi:hypothetical protein
MNETFLAGICRDQCPSGQCYGSGLFIPDPDPDFCPSWIPVATNITKLKIILNLNWLRKNLGQFTKNYRTFYPKKLPLSEKKMGWDPEKNLFRMPGSKRHRIPDPDPQHCSWSA